MEAIIEVFTKGYKKEVDNNYETFDGTRKYFHISIDDATAAEHNFTIDNFWAIIEEALRRMPTGTGTPSEERDSASMAFRNY